MQEIINFIIEQREYLIAAVLMAIAGVLNAWLDRLEDEKAFSTSVFAKWPRSFWLKPASTNRRYKTYSTGKLIVARHNKYNKPVYKPRFKFLGLRSDGALLFLTDGWHLIKFLQWAFVAFAVVTAAGLAWDDWRFWVAWVCTVGVLTNSGLLFYSWVFRGKR